MEIIGRYNEQQSLKQYVESDSPEFVAVYGRRRVGKTFLIKEYFNKSFSFYISGLANATKEEQLENFNATLTGYGKMAYPLTGNWMEAFRQLIHLLEHSKKKGKKVIFIDELPWFDTPRSGFITGLEYFWNSWASSRPDILLIVCGSATSWIINKLLKNHGGLHNRVTRRMSVEPFNLAECEEFFQHKKIVIDRKNMVESYMIFGGIPFYINMFEKGLSLAQNVDKLCFNKNSPLKDEFSILYSSIFKHSENHILVVKALAKKKMGLTREEIIQETKLQGGGLTTTLEELEQCSFVCSYNAYEKKTKERLYQLVDFYSLFYLNFMKNAKQGSEHFWTSIIGSAKHRAWSGYAFEQVCMQHVVQIRQKLGIAGVVSYSAAWRSKKSEPAAQVDLLIDRNDGIINLCEMKYADSEFVIDKKQDENLRNKKAAFIREAKTRKAVHITMATTYGVKHNEYRNNIQSEITMKDLFLKKNIEILIKSIKVMNIKYKEKKEFTAKELQNLFLSVNWSSGHYPDKLVIAMKNSGSVFSAYDGEKLVGLINVLDDGVMTAYIHYLLILPEYQHIGIGAQLIKMVENKYQSYLRIVLIAYEKEVGFYEHCGFKSGEEKVPMFITSLWT